MKTLDKAIFFAATPVFRACFWAGTAAAALMTAVFFASPGFAQTPPQATDRKAAALVAAKIEPAPARKKKKTVATVSSPAVKARTQARAQTPAQTEKAVSKADLLQKKPASPASAPAVSGEGDSKKQASAAKKPSVAPDAVLRQDTESADDAVAVKASAVQSSAKKPLVGAAVATGRASVPAVSLPSEGAASQTAAVPQAGPQAGPQAASATAASATPAGTAIPQETLEGDKPGDSSSKQPDPSSSESSVAAAAPSPVLGWAASFDPAAEVGLEYPLSVGAHVRFYFNDQMYTRIGVGFTSGLLTSGFSRIAPAFDYLSRDEARLIGDVIKNSLFGSFRFGWIPKKTGGPYAEIGIMALAFGKGETSGSVLNSVVETSLSEAGKNRYSVRSNVLNGSFHAGYQIPIEKHIHLNIEAGVLRVIAVEWKGSNGSSAADPLPEEHVDGFTGFLLKKGWIVPTIALWLGFSF